MLWVTITIVNRLLSSRISSSMRAVAIGSSALHGSSISTTSGSTAIVRAMHSRCCCPPDRLRVELGPAAHAVDPRPERDVVVDALGERVRLLEHHPDPAPDLRCRDLGRVE